MTGEHPASQVAEAIADQLADPASIGEAMAARPWWRQSLAHGAPGIALLHVERAAAGLAPWRRAHDWLAYAARPALTTGAGSHLYYGAPALAHALACAAEQRPGSYERALNTIDQAITSEALRRLSAAHARMDAGRLPELAEFDLIRGLTGIGAYLLRRDPGGEAIRGILSYLTHLTQPVTAGGESLPGWWTATSPSGRQDNRLPGGHANCGVAHGIAGPLALLALAALRGVTVPGHHAAIARVCAWLDQWRTSTPYGPVWPYWIDRPQLLAGHRKTTRTQRPSWCYGTSGQFPIN